jgi:hypothetical protein
MEVEDVLEVVAHSVLSGCKTGVSDVKVILDLCKFPVGLFLVTGTR